MADEQDNYTVGGFREFQSGNLERDPDEVVPHSGVVRDEQVDRQMTMRASHHDPDRWDGKPAADYLCVQKNRDILRAEGSETARNAMQNGDMVIASGEPLRNDLREADGEEAPVPTRSGVLARREIPERNAGRD